MFRHITPGSAVSWPAAVDLPCRTCWIAKVLARSLPSNFTWVMGRQGYYGRNAESFTNGPLDISIVCMTTRNKTVDFQIMGQGWAVSPPFLFKHLLCMFLRTFNFNVLLSIATFFQKASHFEVLHDHSSYLATSPFSVVFRRRPEGHLGGSTRNAGTWGNWLHHRGWLLPVPFRHGEMSLVQHVCHVCYTFICGSCWSIYVIISQPSCPVDHPGLPRYVCGHVLHVHPVAPGGIGARNTTGDTLKVHAGPKEACEPASIGALYHSRCQR